MYQAKYWKYKNKYMMLKSKMQKDDTQTYFIHDNGGRPFKCVVIENNQKIQIYKQSDNNESDELVYEEKPALIFQPKRILVGKSPLNKMTEFSGGYGPDFDGNTILLDMGNGEYIYIGDQIWSFDTKYKIVKYISPVGNNDVPYPFAIDDSNNIYLISYNVIIMHRGDIAKLLEKYDNPYDYYGDYALITSEQGIMPVQLPKNDLNIKEWIVGTKPFTLRYEPFYEKNYDSITQQGKQKMYIINSKGEKIELTQQGYMDLMTKFAKLQSFEPLPQKKLYLDRDIRGSLIGFYLEAVSYMKNK